MADSELVPLKKFARQIGRRYSTVWKWWRKGLLNRETGETIFLKTFRNPDRCTTRSAYEQFLERLNRG